MKPSDTPALSQPQLLQIDPAVPGRATRVSPMLHRLGPPAAAPAFVGFEAFCRQIDQLPGLRELQLHGLGEPLLHPRFFDMVGYATARGIEVSTRTALPPLSERRADECVASGLRRMEVSLDEAHLPHAVRGLRRLLEAKRRAGSPFPQVHVEVRGSFEHLPELERLGAEYGAEGFTLR